MYVCIRKANQLGKEKKRKPLLYLSFSLLHITEECSWRTLCAPGWSAHSPLTREGRKEEQKISSLCFILQQSGGETRKRLFISTAAPRRAKTNLGVFLSIPLPSPSQERWLRTEWPPSWLTDITQDPVAVSKRADRKIIIKGLCCSSVVAPSFILCRLPILSYIYCICR